LVWRILGGVRVGMWWEDVTIEGSAKANRAAEESFSTHPNE
jgi:hypothetical protein